MIKTLGEYVEFNPFNPQRVGVCQRCGFTHNLSAMKPQMRWAGKTLINTGLVVCRRCADAPNPQEYTPSLRMDPIPAYDSLPISFPLDAMSPITVDMMRYSVDEINITVDMTETDDA